jgi:hypothetical protein
MSRFSPIKNPLTYGVLYRGWSSLMGNIRDLVR